MLIITDRTELDEQIEKVFKGVNEEIYRTKSGADLIAKLNATDAVADLLAHPQVRRQGRRRGGRATSPSYIEEMKKALPPGFKRQGRSLRLRGRVPPHAVRRAARGDEGDPARARCSSASPARRC